MGNPTGLRDYKGAAAATTIVGALTNSATSFAIVNSNNWPSGAGGNFTIVVDIGTSSEEAMLCTSQVGGVITVLTRGYDGTSAVTHQAGASVLHAPVAIDLAEANTIANFALAPSKTAPLDADMVPGADSASSNATVRFTWANIKAFLKTYFDGYYKFAVATINSSVAVAANSENYVLSNNGAYTLTFPATPNVGDEIRVIDAGGNAFTNNITCNFVGLKFQGAVNNLLIDINRGTAYLKYSGATDGWEIV